MFKLFTKKEVTNSEDISKAMVELSNGKTISIQEMINAVEEDIKAKEAAKNKKNEDEELLEKVVKVNGEDVKVSELIKSYEDKKNKCNEDEDEEEDEKKSKKNEDKDEEKKAKKNKCNEDKDKEEKDNEDIDKRKLIDEVGGFLKDKGLSDEDIRFVIKKMEKESYDKSSSGGKDNDEDPEKKGKKNSKDFIKLLKEAEELENSKTNNSVVADTMDIKLARGAARYGSGK